MPRHWIVTMVGMLALVSNTYAADDVGPIEVCKNFSLIAKEVMMARQKNRPMSETLPAAKDRIKDWADQYEFNVGMAEAEEMAALMVMDA